MKMNADFFFGYIVSAVDSVYKIRLIVSRFFNWGT